MCFILFCESVKNFKRKYNFRIDAILEVLVRLMILTISVMSVIKVSIAGKLIFTTNDNSSFLLTCESKKIIYL